jgi:hypothetical protein
MVEQIMSLGGLSNMIAKKVYASHAPSVQARGIAEHVHGCQLVEKLLPLCEDNGLCIELFDGEDYTPINSVEDMAKHMNACDIEWLCLADGSVDRTEDDDITYVSIVLIYGNNADDVETGRGEMIADWSACDSHWWEIFNPVLDAFIDNREVEVEEVAE